MENEQNTTQMPPHPMPASDQVSFPNPNEPAKKSSGMIKWVVVIVGVIVIVAAGVFFIMNTSSSDTGDAIANATPTTNPDVLNSFDTPTPEATEEPSPTPTPEPVDRAELKAQVLNGTGTAGDAGLVAAILEDLGFEDVDAANADNQDETKTTVTYSEDIDLATIDEIVAELEKTFSDVTTKKGTIAANFDLQIVTGEKN